MIKLINTVKEYIRNLFHPEEEETKKSEPWNLQEKTNTLLGIANKDSKNNNNGYQRLLESPNISPTLKSYIQKSTVFPTTANTGQSIDTSMLLSNIRNPQRRITVSRSIQNHQNPQNTEKTVNNITPQNNQKTTTNNGMGFISAKYECGGNGGTVSSGKGDAGGVSYGISQFSTKTGSADNFISWLKKNNSDMASAFKDYKAGTTEFSNAWKQTFSKYGDSFTNVQKQYTYDNFVKPLVNLAKNKTGIDYTRSSALMELIYSTAIQFGASNLGLSALGNVTSDMSDEQIINASYDKKIANYKSYFKSSSSNVQESVKNRFINERKDVLQLLNK